MNITQIFIIMMLFFSYSCSKGSGPTEDVDSSQKEESTGIDYSSYSFLNPSDINENFPIDSSIRNIIVVDGKIFISSLSTIYVFESNFETNTSQDLTEFTISGIVKVTADNNKNIYIGLTSGGGKPGGIVFSNDQGDTFTNINTDFDQTVNDIKINNSGYIYATKYGGVAISKDSGVSFTETNIWDEHDHSVMLNIEVNENGVVFVSSMYGGGLAISDNNGENFTIKTSFNGLSKDMQIKDLALNSNGTLYMATNEGLAVSSDDGSTFVVRNEDNGMESSDLYCIFVDSNDNIFVGSDKGISISNDGGETFVNLNSSDGLIENSSIDKIFVDNFGVIYANQREVESNISRLKILSNFMKYYP